MGLQTTKIDPELGMKVHQHLLSLGIETPTNMDFVDESSDIKKNTIEQNFSSIMTILGLDLSDDSLQETPRRVAKMFVDELFWGLKPENFPKCTTIKNKMGYDEMLVEKCITTMSSCEHHFVTISGLAHVAYFPADKVIGLSKINRIVSYFSHRPQVQERLTEQVYHALSYILGTPDVAVVIDAEHFCVKSRGVEDYNSSTATSRLGGRFREPEVRSEFFNTIRSC